MSNSINADDDNPQAGNHPPKHAAYGVEALIERLRDEGLAEGRSRAEKIVADAEARARWLLEQAQDEADDLRQQARNESERLKAATEQALSVAARDALLSLKATLSDVFAREIERLVSTEMQNRELLQQLILAVAARAREETEQAERLEIILPRRAVGLEELRRGPEELTDGELTRLVRGVVAENLREGVAFTLAGDDSEGLRVKLLDQGITVDLTDRTVAGLLLEHLQPRFRALLEGIVK